MVAVLIIIDLIVIGIAVGLTRDHDLTIRRMQTVEAMYAAEGGMNMSIREMMEDTDEDVDGGTGTISTKNIGNATVAVTATVAAPLTTLTSIGVSGEARRKMESVLEDPP
jgi:hypothetical protein